MFLKILILLNCLIFGLKRCLAPTPVDAQIAQAAAARSWYANQHVVWELEWPAAPAGGSLTMETWRFQDRYRFEILESAAAALVGETLIFDGQNAWRYNRFEAKLPLTPSAPVLSPASDIFMIINKLVDALPQTAAQELVRLQPGPTQKITLTFENGDSLTLWRDEATGLPVRFLVIINEEQVILQARSFELLTHPPPGLFELSR